MSTGAPTARLRDALGDRRVAWLAPLLGAALAAPALAGGLSGDDWVQRAWVRGDAGFRRPAWDLFAFVPGDPRFLGVSRGAGVLPWYTDASFQLTFLRPLASLTHFAEYALAGDSPWVGHALNVALYALVVAAAWAAYRRLASAPWVAGLATLAFAVDDGHGPAVGWLASRNALLSSLFVALALGAHARALDDARLRAKLAPPVLLALALGSGESGFAFVAFALAHAATLDRRPLAARARSLAPPLAIAFAWRAAVSALGYGARGSSIYLDPLSPPYLRALPGRLALDLASVLAFPSVDAYLGFGAPDVARVTLRSALVVAVVAALLLPALVASARARFFGLALVLATIPACAAYPSDRLLLLPSFAAFGLLAESLALGLGRASLRRALVVAIAAPALFVHLVLAPISFPERAGQMARSGRVVHDASRELWAGADAKTHVVIVRGPEMFGCTFAIGLGYLLGYAHGAHGLCLAAGPSPELVERIDDRTLFVRPEGGFLELVLNRVTWPTARRAEPGETHLVEGALFTVAEVSAAGEPQAAFVRFDRSLDDPSMRLVRWARDRYVPFVAPAVGASVVVSSLDPR